MISDHPRIADPYAALFRYYLEQGQLNGARRVLSVWRAGMPDNVEARLLEATLQLRRTNQREEAERSLNAIARDNADDPEVLANLRAFYTEVDRLPKFIELLEEEVARRPHNYVAVAQLVDAYASGDRKADATRVLDATRQSIAGDVDRLYLIAHLYDRVDQPQMVEQVLLDVLRLDPAFAPAGNDLGYTWADAGQNLERAESLVRRALQEEPDNPMYLDSLGWVMYKRGQFGEARRHLEQAVAAQNFGDPVVLDHLGDVLYRLHDNAEAQQQWKQSLAKLGEIDPKERDDIKNLRLQLNQKLKQAHAGEPVSVAPIVEEPATPKQAKN
jgi:tetratricopeptide (TPR) repeat protein